MGELLFVNRHVAPKNRGKNHNNNNNDDDINETRQRMSIILSWIRIHEFIIGCRNDDVFKAVLFFFYSFYFFFIIFSVIIHFIEHTCITRGFEMQNKWVQTIPIASSIKNRINNSEETMFKYTKEATRTKEYILQYYQDYAMKWSLPILSIWM